MAAAGGADDTLMSGCGPAGTDRVFFTDRGGSAESGGYGVPCTRKDLEAVVADSLKPLYAHFECIEATLNRLVLLKAPRPQEQKVVDIPGQKLQVTSVIMEA